MALLIRGGLLDPGAARRLVLDDPEEAIGGILQASAAAGDTRVLCALSAAGHVLGQIVDTVIGLVDPHAVILGDYLGVLHPYLMPSMASRVRHAEKIKAVDDLDPARVVKGAAFASQAAALAEPLPLTWPIRAGSPE